MTQVNCFLSLVRTIHATSFSSVVDPFHLETAPDPFRGKTDPYPALDPTQNNIKKKSNYDFKCIYGKKNY